MIFEINLFIDPSNFSLEKNFTKMIQFLSYDHLIVYSESNIVLWSVTII